MCEKSEEEILAEIFSKNKELVIIMQNMCEEFEFEVAMYYSLVKEESGDYLSAKNQPYVCANDDEDLKSFWVASQEIQIKKDNYS